MREKLIDIVEAYADFLDWDTKEDLVDSIMEKCFATDNNVGDKLTPTEQKWIPVTERLPDRNDMVIAFYPTMIGTSGEMQIHKAWAMSETCTHWMPLPTPPKEGADNG